MQEFIVASARLTLNYGKVHLEDIPDEQFCRLPQGIANHPAWIVGHLIVSGAASCQALGLGTSLPASWERIFEFGKPATADRAAYPGKTELLETYLGQSERVIAAFCKAKPAVLAKPLTDPFLKTIFANAGSLIVSGLTTHPAIHFGQLSAWRRAMGMPLHI